jgi:hypothetical protein
MTMTCLLAIDRINLVDRIASASPTDPTMPSQVRRNRLAIGRMAGRVRHDAEQRITRRENWWSASATGRGQADPPISRRASGE